ncbi:MAG: Cys-tRNA(Pro) deacylase [Paludibacteraceae bacterium]|nr:Cys-tRNA(Pro) deacylase [Paludibacteraceae bacterium]
MPKDKIQKTNACRLLDAQGIAYDLIAYPVDPDDLSATHVASTLGEAPECVFKTIVMHGDRNGYFACLIPAGHEIDLKKAARASGNKSCQPIPLKQLLPLTGYIRGGCTPLGMKQRMQVWIDMSCLTHERIYISAGQRGLQLHLNPQDLIRFTNAQTAELTQDNDPKKP